MSTKKTEAEKKIENLSRAVEEQNRKVAAARARIAELEKRLGDPGTVQTKLQRSIDRAKTHLRKQEKKAKLKTTQLVIAQKAAGQIAKTATDQADALNAESEAGRAELRFQEQCYLIQNFEKITQISEATRYLTTTQLMNDDPAYFISQITSIKGISPLFKGKPSDYAALVPKIMIFKTSPSGDSDIPLPFSTFSSKPALEDVFKSGRGRGDDVVLKSISFDFKNNNIALAKRLVEVQIKLLFASAKSLVLKREGFKYLDLFLRGGSGSRDIPAGHREFNGPDYRIKAVVGWQVPPDVQGQLSDDFKKTIKKAMATMFLELRNYDLDFQENGMLEVTLDYTSFIESLLESPELDIFLRTAEEAEKQQKAQQAVKQQAATQKGNLKQSQQAGASPATIAAQKQKISNFENTVKFALQRRRMKKYQTILDGLQKKIYYVEVPWTEITILAEAQKKVKIASRKGNAQRRKIIAGMIKQRKGPPPVVQKMNGVDPTQANYQNKVQQTVNVGSKPTTAKIKELNEKKEAILKQAATSFDPNLPSADNTERISFFFFGDLLDAVIAESTPELRKNMEDNRIRVLLGPVTFFNFFTGRAEMKNLADIPISMKLFLEFFHNRIVKIDREKYPLHAFLRDTINYLIVPALGERCFEGAGNHKCEMRLLSAPGKNGGKTDRVPKGRIHARDISGESTKLNLSNEYTPAKNLFNYIIVYVSSAKAHSLTGNMDSDHKIGVYHLALGADRGLLKSAKFKKMKIKYAPEMMAERSMNPGADTAIQLWNPYNADLTLIGNAIFKPGQKLYIDVGSTGLGRPGPVGSSSPARTLGLGGYYMVTAASNVIDQNGWKTDITCIFDSSGNNSAPPPLGTPMESESAKASYVKTQTSVDDKPSTTSTFGS